MAINTGGAPMTIADGIRTFSKAQPGQTAIIDGERSLNYGELGARSNRLAHALLHSELPGGARVAVLLGNRLEYCEIAAGIANAGMIMVPLNPRLTPPEADYILQHSEANALIVDNALADVIGEVGPAIRHVWSIDGTRLGADYEDALAGADADDPAVPIDEQAPFCITYTSGTTGRPRGVVISHRSRSLTFYVSALEWNLGVGRRSIAVAPMYHGAGFAFGYSPVHTGGTVCMLRRWDPAALLAMIEREQAQSVFLVPTHAQMLRALGDEKIKSYDLSSLDTLFFNAAALPTTIKAWVLDTFPGVGVHELYGSTEAAIVTDLRPVDARRKSGSVGHAWFQTELRVCDDDGRPVQAGTPGELFSRSPYLMSGYLKDAAATEACTTEDGFLSSGDVAIRDEDGYIYIVDRKKDIIISGGVNVFPREIEEAILTHPDVADVAVVGLPDEKWGEQVTATVVLRSGTALTADDLDAHLRPQLAGYKLPRRLEILEALPRNASGKVLKRTLRDTLS